MPQRIPRPLSNLFVRRSIAKFNLESFSENFVVLKRFFRSAQSRCVIRRRTVNVTLFCHSKQKSSKIHPNNRPNILNNQTH
jgi:hypothetical protein